MRATAVHVCNPFRPALGARITPVRRRRKIANLALALRVPPRTLAIHNGEYLARAEWRYRKLKDGDELVFVTLPGGSGGRGGGSNPLNIVLQLAVMAFAGPIAGWANGALGLGLGADSFGFALLKGAIGFGLSSLVASVTATPKASAAQQMATLAAPSPTYSLQAQGNQARLGMAIPAQYGRLKSFPDLGADPYADYSDNDQYLYQLFILGQGYYDIESINIADTPISSFPEITTEIVEPGGTVTLFPANVVTSNEVAGQEATYNVALGPFVATGAGVLANAIAIDVVCPRGLYYANDSGGLDARSVSWTVAALPIDDAGQPTGEWATLGNESISAATTTAQRRSYRYAVTAARYMVRLTRTNAKDASSRAGNDLNWAGLRCFVPGNQQYGAVTAIAMRMLATNSLSSQSARAVNVLATRKLPTWNPTTGWSQPTATRSIAWAVADACRATYGANRSDSRYDLAQLYALEQILEARGDHFDYRFDSALSFWDAITTILRAGRAQPYKQGGVIRFVRDQAQTVPRQMFTMRNIVRGSMQIDVSFPPEDDVDSVEVEFWDARYWAPNWVLCKLPDSAGANPAKVKLDGVTDWDHAWREGVTMAAQHRYRRAQVTFDTELEGQIPTLLDLVAISHDMPEWGASGEILSVTNLLGGVGVAAGGVLELSEPIAFTAGNHYIALRRLDGRVSGPWRVVSGDDDRHVVLAEEIPNFQPYVGQDKERTHFSFGAGANLYLRARVVAPLNYKNGNAIEMHVIAEDDRVHTADQGSTPTAPPLWTLPGKITAPTVRGLVVTFAGTVGNPALTASWEPAQGADHYLVETAVDGGNWNRVGDTTATHQQIPTVDLPIKIRVAAVGLLRGDWVEWAGDPRSMISIPPNVSGLALAEPFVGASCRVAWTAAARASSYRAEVWAGGSLRRTLLGTATTLAYSADDGRADGGPWRDLEFRVWAINGAGQSAAAATLTANNPAPAAVTNVQVFGGFLTAYLTYAKPADRDFAGVRVCMSTVSGFTPGDTNVAYQGPDALATITGLTAGVTYYFRIAAYDAFGTDTLNFGATQYSLTATSSGLTAQEILERLVASLTDPENQDGNLILDAERFGLRISGTDRFPFAVGQVGGQDVIALSADVLINGNLSVANLRTGALPTDVLMRLGGGTIELDGAGAIRVFKALGANQDYLFLSAGKLSFQKYIASLGAYVQYNSLQRREQGVANNGATVQLPGYWASQPSVLVSPASLGVYNHTYAAQDQAIICSPGNVVETSPGSGQWTITPTATLNISALTGSLAINEGSGDISSDAWTSGTYTTAANCTSITPSVTLKSQRGNGIGQWLYRSMRWRVEYWNSSAWVPSAWRVLDMGAQFQAVNDSVQVGFPSAGAWQWRIAVEDYDISSAVFGSASHAYSQSTVTAPQVDATRSLALFGTTSASSSFSAPGGSGEIYRVIYTWNVQTEVTLNPDPSYTGLLLVAADAYSYVSGSQVWNRHFAQQLNGHSNINSSPLAFTVEGNNLSFDSNALSVSTVVPSSSPFSINTLRNSLINMQATVFRRTLVANSTTPTNNSYIGGVGYSLAAAQVLATGTLNYLAVGE